MIGVYDHPPDPDCHGLSSLPLGRSPLGYEWKVEQWFTRQRDRIVGWLEGGLESLP